MEIDTNSNTIQKLGRKYILEESPIDDIDNGNETTQHLPSQNDGGLTSFCDYVKLVLQRFPELQRIKAKNAIFEIIYKYELDLARDQSE